MPTQRAPRTPKDIPSDPASAEAESIDEALQTPQARDYLDKFLELKLSQIKTELDRKHEEARQVERQAFELQMKNMRLEMEALTKARAEEAARGGNLPWIGAEGVQQYSFVIPKAVYLAAKWLGEQEKGLKAFVIKAVEEKVRAELAKRNLESSLVVDDDNPRKAKT